MSRLRLLLGGLSVAVLLVTVSACADSPTRAGGEPSVSASQSGGNDSSSQQWLAFGSVILTDRSKAASDPNENPGTFGPYLSAPVDVTGNGNITLRVGPVKDSDAGTVPGAINFPSDMKGRFQVEPDLGKATTVTEGSDVYVDIPATVIDFTQSYSGLRVWMQ